MLIMLTSKENDNFIISVLTRHLEYKLDKPTTGKVQDTR